MRNDDEFGTLVIDSVNRVTENAALRLMAAKQQACKNAKGRLVLPKHYQEAMALERAAMRFVTYWDKADVLEFICNNISRNMTTRQASAILDECEYIIDYADCLNSPIEIKDYDCDSFSRLLRKWHKAPAIS